MKIKGKSDIEIACDFIRSCRKRGKIKVCKTISVPPITISGTKVMIRTITTYNLNTGIVSLAHGLGHKTFAFFPTVNQKLVCIDQHTLDMLEKDRERSRRNYAKRREIMKKIITTNR